MTFLKKHRYRLTAISLGLSLMLALVGVSPAKVSPDNAKPPVETVRVLPFESGEHLVYEGEFTRSLLRGINIADLKFSFNRVPSSKRTNSDVESQTVLRFIADVVSKGIVSKLFGLNFRQRVESIVEPTSFSVLQTTKLDEQGKRRRTSEAVFDPNTGKVVFTELDPNDPNRPPRVVTTEIDGQVQDIASAFYYLRTQKLEPGMTLELLISDTGVLYRIPVKVGKRETLKTVLGKIPTIQIVPEMFGEGRLIRGKGEITIWFTDDERHIPVRAKINNSMGRLDIKLKSMEKGK